MRKIVIAAVAAAIAMPASAAVELVKNGSFELNNVNDGDKKYFTQSGVEHWSGGANLTFIASPGTADDPSKYLAVYGPFPETSPDGGDFVLADGDPPFAGAFWQTIEGLTIGQTYELNFWQAAGQQLDFKGPTTERWEVSFGDEVKLSSLFELPEGGVGPWEKQTMLFTATATSQVLKFLAVGTPGGAPPISFLDGVSLQATGGVPEPATWAMMLLGFGAVGFAARRRAAATAVSA
ncbi:PEPxxWA-CTERM sorting domain-containing protein [Sandaracinobacter sp. RS1-74]|uniref:PEPxxWA-CTERM sorting domain-containing protein n=1 Tax=Sandaracinobacteroides sayramensis TaxID=2913411 RepID=UPI001EDC512A|nr:PEPxxWA-CTERM sorting domain-containing protein [Sandaracinobacteroides sayramensis]MCG2840022.1 PEPxxWA-CTERM sorting domain-containing protein [Sandaracinobacteroides sayramensis]